METTTHVNYSIQLEKLADSIIIPFRGWEVDIVLDSDSVDSACKSIFGLFSLDDLKDSINQIVDYINFLNELGALPVVGDVVDDMDLFAFTLVRRDFNPTKKNIRLRFEVSY